MFEVTKRVILTHDAIAHSCGMRLSSVPWEIIYFYWIEPKVMYLVHIMYSQFVGVYVTATCGWLQEEKWDAVKAWALSKFALWFCHEEPDGRPKKQGNQGVLNIMYEQKTLGKTESDWIS